MKVLHLQNRNHSKTCNIDLKRNNLRRVVGQVLFWCRQTTCYPKCSLRLVIDISPAVHASCRQLRGLKNSILPFAGNLDRLKHCLLYMLDRHDSLLRAPGHSNEYNKLVKHHTLWGILDMM